MRFHPTSLLTGLLLLGCGDIHHYPELEGCQIESSQGIRLLTGEQADIEALDGQTLNLTYGFQGGYHVYAGVLLDEEPVGAVKLSLNMCQGDTVVARGRGQATVQKTSEGYRSGAHLVYVLHDYQASQLHGKEGSLNVLAEDDTGRRWSKRITVLPKCCD